MKKLLYLSTRLFWPTKSGHEVHIYNYCKILHEKCGYLVDVYIFDEKQAVEEGRRTKPHFLNEIFCGNKISKCNFLHNLISKTLFGNEHWAVQLSLYYNKNNLSVLNLLNEKNRYDVLLVDMVRLAPYLRAFMNKPELCILDMGDMLSKRYKRQMNNVTEKSNVGGAYTNKKTKMVQRFLNLKWIQKMILAVESKLMIRSELFWAEQFDRVILVSDIETKELNNHFSKTKAVTVHVGIDCNYFNEFSGLRREDGFVSFVGDMRTSANSDTVRHIINDILPLCKNVKRMIFIGKCPEELKKEFKESNTVQFVGAVPDVRIEIGKTSAFLAPMTYGTGIKIKIVEAMAMKMPVITSEVGAEGIPGKNGVHWYVGSTDIEIARSLDEVLADKQKRKDMGEIAQQLVEQEFGWNATQKAFEMAGL